MPATDWALYRVGARLGAIDDFLPRTDPARATRDRVQRLISTVAVAGSIAPPAAENSRQVDNRFVARLALGLLARGWPTLASPAVEKAVLGGMVPGAGLRAAPVERFGEVGWSLSPEGEGAENGWPAALAAALSAGDPRLVSAPKELDEAETPADPLRALMWDSVSERRFYRGEVAELLGNALGLVELQRPLDTMVPPEAQPEQGPWVSLPWRRADFSLELPGSDNPWRLNIELDGPHHREPTQKARDRVRDEVLTKAGWTVVRVPIEALDAQDHPSLIKLRGEVQRRKTRDPTFRALVDGTPVDPADPVGLEALRLLVTPHAVARVQLGVVLAMLNGALRLDAPTWEIVAVEREVPCAEAALVDLLQTLLHLCRLYGIPFGVEGVRLRVAQEHLAALPSLTMDGFPEEIRGLVAAESLVAIGDPTDVPDLVLDAAVLARPTQVYPTYPSAALGVVSRTHLVLRTAHRSAGTEPLIWDASRPVSLEPPEHSTGWDAADGADSDLAGVSIPGAGAAPQAPRVPLRYFLQTLFRKRDFRPGQLEIIDRAPARRDAIGLPPTGAGKSICYQLPALLSPGKTLVVDPLKSLLLVH
ncbi:MAG: ATP-dependent DNA helicase RecQ [uncultured Thermomicrobiales bacterium]|uniref:DNA 3'-5' helicase n=1 Tax=uncultured Thermomicrobiales bacterium TaxID=1645740 RepID=A0A6J4VK30_9BACT|nr:MAG: ATP-dependent DNA helicase RecQ [uncultured Thermomicrobiales bacterium]